MPFLIFIMWLAVFLQGLRKMRFYKHVGQTAYATTLYKRLAWALSGLMALSMGAQIYLAHLVGANLIQTVLPLHLCGMMGVLTAPMLLTNFRPLRAFYVYLGLPSGLLALVFPAIMPSIHAGLMTLAFSTLHSLIVLSAMLALFRMPQLRPGEAVLAWGIGVVFLGAVGLINNALDTNYLFLRAAPLGTPLETLFTLGEMGYTLSLIGIAAAVLVCEAAVVYALSKTRSP